MAAHALGTVTGTSTTTAVRATANQPDPAARLPAAALFFQAAGANSGSVFICAKETPDLTRDVFAEVVAGGSWSVGDPGQRAGFNAADFWILPVTAGEGVRVTVVT